jgi:type II secretory pathway pseudopilin PulG
MSRHSSEAGFTLVELSIGLLLTGLLMAGVFGVLSVSLEFRARSDRSTELQQTARYAMDLMVRELQYARKITAVSQESISFSTEQFGYSDIAYRLDKTATPWILRRDDSSGGDQPVTGGGTAVRVSVSELTFKTLKLNYLGDPLTVGIEIEVTDLAIADAAKRPTYRLRTAVTGLNIPTN